MFRFVADWYRAREREANAKRAARRRAQERERLLRQQREQAEAEERRKRRRRLQDQERKRRKQQAAILEILNEDKLPDVDVSALGYIPFKLQKTEHLIYVFKDVQYYEKRIKREIVGRSSGASMRVAKGLYVRAGASRGTPVEREIVQDRGVGMMGVTSRHLYFSGERSFRIRFDKIVTIEPYSDGVEVTRDRASALPEYFITGDKDAKFAYELLAAIPSLELPRNPELEQMDNQVLMLPIPHDIDDYH